MLSFVCEDLFRFFLVNLCVICFSFFVCWSLFNMVSFNKCMCMDKFCCLCCNCLIVFMVFIYWFCLIRMLIFDFVWLSCSFVFNFVVWFKFLFLVLRFLFISLSWYVYEVEIVKLIIIVMSIVIEVFISVWCWLLNFCSMYICDGGWVKMGLLFRYCLMLWEKLVMVL